MAGCAGVIRHHAPVLRFLAIWVWLIASPARAEPLAIRVVAANLTSDKMQAYSPDNGNHSNPEGAGARILTALKPDIVLIQEFNTTMPARQWVNRTFGEGFAFTREEGKQIPNGIISRFPILASGSWDDPVLDNREFAWARLGLPGNRELWAVSVHLHSKGSASRAKQAAALVRLTREHLPPNAMLLLGGDLNTRHADETCLTELAAVCVVNAKPPVDDFGNPATNTPRNRPYDWVLASPPLDRHQEPVRLGGLVFPNGLVFDTRVFRALDKTPPARKEDSAVPFMQHMAVVRDFVLP
jgi:endonuclease/exonuclease/phosphatase family metal-dependent hydrolase